MTLYLPATSISGIATEPPAQDEQREIELPHEHQALSPRVQLDRTHWIWDVFPH